MNKKRTTIFLEESQIQKINAIAKRLKIPPAQLIRTAIDFYLSLSEPTGPMADVEFVRQKMIEKRGGDDVDYREVLRELAYEKAIEYRNLKNNSARITTLVEKEEVTQETLVMVVQSIDEMKQEVLAALVKEVKRLGEAIDRLTEANHVQPIDNQPVQ